LPYTNQAGDDERKIQMQMSLRVAPLPVEKGRVEANKHPCAVLVRRKEKESAGGPADVGGGGHCREISSDHAKGSAAAGTDGRATDGMGWDGVSRR
jgi:hypothetical protein